MRRALAGHGEQFLALRVDTIANMGAYLSEYGPSVAVDGSSMTPGPYDIAAVAVRVRGVFTNTVPTDAYRGAGRPEACYVLERLADRAAEALGIDRAEIRRRNLVRKDGGEA